MGSIFRFLDGSPLLRFLHGFIESDKKCKLARVANRSGDCLPDNDMDGLIHIVRQALVNLHILSPRSLKPTAMSIAQLVILFHTICMEKFENECLKL